MPASVAAEPEKSTVLFVVCPLEVPPAGAESAARARAWRHGEPAPRSTPPAVVLRPAAAAWQSALLNFNSFLIVLLLFICTSTYLRSTRPSMFREKKPGCARRRRSPTPRARRVPVSAGACRRAQALRTGLQGFRHRCAVHTPTPASPAVALSIVRARRRHKVKPVRVLRLRAHGVHRPLLLRPQRLRCVPSGAWSCCGGAAPASCAASTRRTGRSTRAHNAAQWSRSTSLAIYDSDIDMPAACETHSHSAA